MGKIAFVFSGQGDQYPGMGRELYEKYATARKIYELCDSIRQDTSKQSFFGTDEELKETKNTQPCLFAFELAQLAVLKERGVHPDVLAGFSMGEVAAATAAGVFEISEGFRLICRRAELMQSAAESVDAAMVAVIKLSEGTVREICNRFDDVYPVNFNCPAQITVSGLATQMPDFCAAVKEAGGRALPLKVKGGFHSPFMKEASASFAKELSGYRVKKPNTPLYSNLTAQPYEGDAADLLARQICNPVMWEASIKNMIAEGVDTFIEIGPGKTLTNMIKKISAEVKAISAEDILKDFNDSEVKVC